MRSSLLLLLIALVFSHASAATEEKETGSVEGKITLDGKPLVKGKVAFHPEKGKAVEVDVKDGAYSAKGVPTGNLRVTIKGEGVPAKFSDKDKTTLRYNMVKGENKVDLRLEK